MAIDLVRIDLVTPSPVKSLVRFSSGFAVGAISSRAEICLHSGRGGYHACNADGLSVLHYIQKVQS